MIIRYSPVFKLTRATFIPRLEILDFGGFGVWGLWDETFCESLPCRVLGLSEEMKKNCRV